MAITLNTVSNYKETPESLVCFSCSSNDNVIFFPVTGKQQCHRSLPAPTRCLQRLLIYLQHQTSLLECTSLELIKWQGEREGKPTQRWGGKKLPK